MVIRNWIGVAIIAGGIALVFFRFHTHADDAVRPIPDTVSNAPVGDPASMMQAKMTASQRVLRGLLNRDFNAVKTSAAILNQLAVSAPNLKETGRKDLIYEHFRTEFIRLSEQLEAMANHANLEGAAYVHQNMTATCIACHQHLRDRNSSE